MSLLQTSPFFLQMFGLLLHLQTLPALLLQLLLQSLLQAPPFFLQALDLAFASCRRLSPSLEVFHQSWIYSFQILRKLPALLRPSLQFFRRRSPFFAQQLGALLMIAQQLVTALA
jgi:hypothetical protein